MAYASRAGSTAEVAEVIGQVLREHGAEVDVCSVKDAPSVAGYDALVLGSAIWAGRPLPEALRFATQQQPVLAGRPVAYFVLCERLRDDTPANRAIARGFPAPLERVQPPVSVALFAGKRDLSTTHPVVAWLLRHLFGIRNGDWRNWDEIRAWAAALAPLFARPQPALAAAG